VLVGVDLKTTMDMDDYESLPPSTPLYVSCTAGALAGVAEHCAMFPVDSVKTRMQSLSCSKQRSLSMRQMMRTIVQEEGILRPWKGMSAMALGAGPAHAMYFTCLEVGKEKAENLGLSNKIGFMVDGVSAIFATICHDAVMTPAEVVKQRMQMCCSPFSGCANAALTIYQTEGIKAFYRSYFTQLTMNVPFQASLVATYMGIQRYLNPNNEYNPAIHFIAGALAGGVASTVTMPFDNCKTLLNTQEAGVLKKIEVSEINGLGSAAKSISKMVGVRGFFSGLTARILYQAPSTAISWSIYELVKYCMKTGNEGDDKYETLNSLKDERGSNPGGIKEPTETRLETEKHNRINLLGKDDHCVGSSVSHTMAYNSDNPLLPQYLKPISNSQYFSNSSINKDSANRTVGLS